MNGEIIKPFEFYPSDKKFIPQDKQFIFEYDPLTNTYIMYNHKIKIINMPNDDWFIIFMRDYVCTFECYNENAIRTNLTIKHDDGTFERKIFSLARICSYLYHITPLITDTLVSFKSKTFRDEYGRVVQDVNINNINITTNKLCLEDNYFAYIKIENLDLFVRVNKEIKNYIINECGNLIFNNIKGIRATERSKGASSNSINNIVFNFFGGNYDRKTGVRQINESTQFHPELNIYFKDYTFDNLYSGAIFRVDDKYAYIYMPRYGVETRFDRFIYDNHKQEFESQVWYFDDGHACTNIIKGIQGLGLHRFIFMLLCNDYNIDYNIINNYAIHHLNIDGLDNTLENLYICNLSNHTAIHNYLDYGSSNTELGLKSNIIEILNLGYIPEINIKK